MYTFFKVLICRCLYYKQKKNLKVMIGKLKSEFRKKRVCNLFFSHSVHKNDDSRWKAFFKVQIDLFTFRLMFSHMSSWKIRQSFFQKIFFCEIQCKTPNVCSFKVSLSLQLMLIASPTTIPKKRIHFENIILQIHSLQSCYLYFLKSLLKNTVFNLGGKKFNLLLL